MLVYSPLENFHENANFLSNYNKFCGLQNSNSFSQSLNYINKKSVPNLLRHMTFRHCTQSYHMIN